jgi:molybdenum cofactor synthesis domain-containing protein
VDPAPARRTAAILLIGNELLSGKVQDQNFSYLARELYSLGVELRRAVVILDFVEVIAEEVRALAASHDIVFTSGGVGPTHDDVTIEGVARAFQRKVVPIPELETQMREYYGERLTPNHLRMALAPEGVELVSGQSTRWPTMKVENVYILPGVPEIFRLKLDALKERLATDPFTLAEIFLDCDEAGVAQVLFDAAANHPAVQIGSYPRFDEGADHRVKITLESKERARVEAALRELRASLPRAEILRVTEPHSPRRG